MKSFSTAVTHPKHQGRAWNIMSAENTVGSGRRNSVCTMSRSETVYGKKERGAGCVQAAEFRRC